MKEVSISFLSSKYITDDILRINNSSANYIHVDVMDGRFVKRRKNPYKKILKLQNKLSKKLDVHLMVKNPLKLINYYASLNTEYITIHIELKDVDKYLDLIKQYGIKCGLAISPDSDISLLYPYISKIDLIIIMGVYPGMGGQIFIDNTINRLKEIKKMIINSGSHAKISIDGGVNDEVAKKLSSADILVSGSYLLNDGVLEERIGLLRNNSKGCDYNEENI